MTSTVPSIAPLQDDDYRTLLLQLIANLTLCEHMGDVSGDVGLVLRKMGLDLEWGDWDELAEHLRKLGVTTLNGTSLEP